MLSFCRPAFYGLGFLLLSLVGALDRGNLFAMGSSGASLSQGDFNPFSEEVASESGFMIDMATGQLLYAKNPHHPIHPASTTKMITALISYRLLYNRLDEVVTITREMVGAISPEKKRASNYTMPSHWIETASSHMGLKVGEQMSVRDLFKGCLVVSANDASNALALTACGNYKTFVELMNATAKELGCTHTCFTNPHGLYHPDQVSTAHDLALIGRALMQEPFLKEVVSQRAFHRPKTNKQEPAVMHNSNRLIQPGKYFSPWACGIKTGFTQQSGGSLVSCAKSGDRCVILAVTGHSVFVQVFEDSKKLIQQVMTEPKIDQWFYRAGSRLPYECHVNGAAMPIQANVKEDVKLSTYASQEFAVKGQLRWLPLVPPISRGQYVGKIEVVTPDGRVVASSSLLAAFDVKPTLLFQLRHWLHLNPWGGFGFLIALGCIGFWFKARCRIRR